MGKRDQGQPDGQGQRAVGDQARLTEAARQGADESSLDRHAQHPDEGEHVPVLLRPPSEFALGPHGEGGFQPGEDERGKEGQADQHPDVGALQGFLELGPALGRRLRRQARADFGRQGLLETDEGQGQGRQRQSGGGQRRGLEIGVEGVGAGEDTADGGTGHEAQPEGRANHAHALGPVLRRRHVGDVGESGRDVPGHRAAQRPRREQHPQAVHEGEAPIRDDRAGEGQQQHRAPPHPVAQAPPYGCRHELGERIGRHHQADHEGRGVERLGVERQQRDDQAKADQIDKHDEKQDQHAGVVVWGSGWRGRLPEGIAREMSTPGYGASLGQRRRRRGGGSACIPSPKVGGRRLGQDTNAG